MKPTILKSALSLISGALLLPAGSASAQSLYSNTVMALNPVAYWPLQETTPNYNILPTTVQNYGTLGATYDGMWVGYNASAGGGGTISAAGEGFYMAVPGPLGSGNVGNAVTPPQNNTATYTDIENPYAAGVTSPATNWTFEFWVNIYDPNAAMTLACDMTVASNPNRSGWVIYNTVPAAGQCGMRIYNTAGGTTTLALCPANTLVPGAWHHIAVTCDALTNFTSYCDGAQVSTVNCAGNWQPNLGGDSGDDTGSGASIGPWSLCMYCRPTSGHYGPMDGALAEVAYYTNCLSSSDVANDYAARNSVTTYENLVSARQPQFWYKFDELPVTPVANNSGSLGAATDGYYPPMPSSPIAPGVAGPTGPGFPAPSYACEFGQGSRATTWDSGVPCDGNPGTLVPGGSISVIAWVRTYDVAVGWYQDILGHGDSSFWLTLDTSGYPHFGCGGTDLASTLGSIADQNWHFVAGVYNSTNSTAYLYVDGNPAQLQTSVSAPSKLRAFLLGGAPDYYDRNFSGDLAHAAIFSQALSIAQVQNLWVTGTGITPPVFTHGVFPGASPATCWSSSTYTFAPTVVESQGKTLTNVWTLATGAGSPVTVATLVGASPATPTISFQSLGLTAGNTYTLSDVASSINGDTTNSVTLTVVAPPAATTTLYSDSFTRSGALDGSTPDAVDLDGAPWSAWDGGFTCNGTQATTASTLSFDAWLPFVPQSGHMYILSCDMDPLNTDNNYLGLGFSTGQSTAPGSGIVSALLARGNRASGSGGCVVLSGTSASSPNNPAYDASGPSTYQIELDATTSPWTVTFLEDGIVQLAGSQYDANPAIASVVIQNYDTGGGTFDNFKLTDSLTPSGAPVIVENPPAQLLAVQCFPVSMTGFAQGVPTITYKWQLNSQNLSDNGRITGTHATTLHISSAQPGDAGSYTLIAQNGSGSVTSSPCVLAVDVGPVSFADASAWTTNVSSVSEQYFVPMLADGVLTLTEKNDDGAQGGQVGTAFYNIPQYIGAFYAQFTYQAVAIPGASSAGDGAVFCLQNDPRGPAAVGGSAGGMTFGVGGNGGGTTRVSPSLELCLNLNRGQQSIGFDWETNGIIGQSGVFYLTPGGVNLLDGAPITISMYYNGANLALTFVDPGMTNAYVTSAAATYSTNLFVGSISAMLGTSYAYVGFGGDDVMSWSLQTIMNFTFISLPTLPPLHIAQNGSGVSVITWPGTFAGFSLQQKADVAAANWVSVTNPVAINASGNCEVTVPTADGSKFYRLTTLLR